MKFHNLTLTLEHNVFDSCILTEGSKKFSHVSFDVFLSRSLVNYPLPFNFQTLNTANICLKISLSYNGSMTWAFHTQERVGMVGIYYSCLSLSCHWEQLSGDAPVGAGFSYPVELSCSRTLNNAVCHNHIMKSVCKCNVDGQVLGTKGGFYRK